MTPERWKQVEQLYYSALELEAEQRVPFLAQACGEDEALRREVESLLAAHEQASGFLSQPAFENEAGGLTEDQSTIQFKTLVGSLISHYLIVSRLGAGGMGEVFLAEDTRLRRKVALKLLPAQFAGDADRVRRFEQESQAISALNHPNILTIYDTGHHDDLYFMATEFVDGCTLRAHMNERGNLPADEAIGIAQQIAAALAAAHEAGIVHRDIKPENVMLRRDGYVKVLDFGLAKVIERSGHDERVAPSGITEAGTVMGTVSYMSPEQARGQRLDARSDIFSLGVVIYAMVAGRLPFGGETTSDVIASILRSDPASLRQLAPQTPEELNRLVMKALVKDREARWQSAGELARELRQLAQELEFQARLRHSAESRTDATSEYATQIIQPQSSRGKSGETPAQTPPPGSISKRRVRIVASSAVIIALLILSAVWWKAKAPQTPNAPVETLAVLPFVLLGGAGEDKYLSLGLADALITKLSSVRRIIVRPTQSVLKYQTGNIEPDQAGRELKVDAVLVGSVQKADDQVRVRVQLIRTEGAQLIWGDQYSQSFSDIFALQDALSAQVVSALALQLTGAEQQQMVKRYTEEADAYRLYLQGRYHQNRRDEQGLKKSIEYFRQAVARDPDYALAYTGLADSYSYLGNHGFLPPDEVSPKAKAAAEKALSADDTLAEAHTALAYISSIYDWEWSRAERGYKRAIELNPRYPSTFNLYSAYLSGQGRHDEALAQMSRALEPDPLSLIENANLGWKLYMARRYDQALAQLQKTIELDPNHGYTHRNLGLVYEQKQMYEEAIAEFQKASTLYGGNPSVTAMLAHAYAIAGKRRESLQTLDELQKLAKQKYVSAYDLAVVATGLGKNDQAFALLAQAYEQRDGWLAFWFKPDPRLDPLRSDPRFTELLRRLRL